MNDLARIEQCFAGCREQLCGVVIESTFNWYWLVDGLMERGYQVHLANTTAIEQYNGLMHTDDDSDAEYLAWAFVEAAHFAIRHSPAIRRFHERKKARTNAIVAIKTVAHKLARAAFYILRDQVPFDVQRAFG